MRKTKHYWNETEWRFVVYALNEYRTALIEQGQYTDTVDDALHKIMTAKIRKVRV